jgi:hypothetical protein
MYTFMEEPGSTLQTLQTLPWQRSARGAAVAPDSGLEIQHPWLQSASFLSLRRGRRFAADCAPIGASRIRPLTDHDHVNRSNNQWGIAAGDYLDPELHWAALLPAVPARIRRLAARDTGAASPTPRYQRDTWQRLNAIF